MQQQRSRRVGVNLNFLVPGRLPQGFAEPSLWLGAWGVTLEKCRQGQDILSLVCMGFHLFHTPHNKTGLCHIPSWCGVGWRLRHPNWGMLKGSSIFAPATHKSRFIRGPRNKMTSCQILLGASWININNKKRNLVNTYILLRTCYAYFAKFMLSLFQIIHFFIIFTRKHSKWNKDQ